VNFTGETARLNRLLYLSPRKAAQATEAVSEYLPILLSGQRTSSLADQSRGSELKCSKAGLANERKYILHSSPGIYHIPKLSPPL
jgi:hypothetical protein